MTTRTLRTTFTAFAIGAIVSFATTARLHAQTDIKTGTEATRIAVVKGHDVYVRCGAAESYYTFAKLKDGDLVKITGERYEWSRVMPAGPAFGESYGFIKYTKGDAGKFKLAADGKSGVTLGKIDVIAPNLDAKGNAKDSWKSLVRLEADQTLRVLETTTTDKDTIHKIVLPESAQGWVSTAHLEAASPDQTKQFTAQLATYVRGQTQPETVNTTAAKTATEESTSQSTPTTSGSTTTALNTTQATNTLTDTDDTSTEATSADSETGATVADATTTTTPPAPEPPKLPTLEDLEAALKKLQKEPIETAEVLPLRELYLDLAGRSTREAKTLRYANGRAEQLQVWADIQKKRLEVDAMRERARMSSEETLAVQRALESSAEYVAVGRVAASTIYDGQNLPKLLRLQDASTGRTIAYLHLDEEYEAANLIGNLVGIVGERTYDGSLRLNIVEPKRIDLLLPEQRTATVPWDMAQPQ